MMWLRITLDILLVVSAIVLPWWVTLCIMVVLMLCFQNFIEAIAVGFFMDALYAGGNGVYGVFLFFSVVTLVLYVSTTYVKRFIRVNRV